MSTPQTTSILPFLSSGIHTQPPVCQWVELANTEELTALLLAVHGVPLTWLEWTEEKAALAEKQGREITSRVGYRLSILQNGITLLQECKFLCDIFENALRSSFIRFVSSNQITYLHLYPENLRKKYRNLQNLLPKDENTIIEKGFILKTGFDQLVRTMALNWNTVPLINSNNEARLIGFSSFFWHDKNCRDKNVFQNDMDQIRKIRNIVAHSSELFSPEDIRFLKTKVCKWLTPLNIELMQKVNAYRTNRPRFLYDLDNK